MTINDVFGRFQRMPAIESTNGRYEIETAETVNFKFKKMQIRANGTYLSRSDVSLLIMG